MVPYHSINIKKKKLSREHHWLEQHNRVNIQLNLYSKSRPSFEFFHIKMAEFTIDTNEDRLETLTVPDEPEDFSAMTQIQNRQDIARNT